MPKYKYEHITIMASFRLEIILASVTKNEFFDKLMVQIPILYVYRNTKVQHSTFSSFFLNL